MTPLRKIRQVYTSQPTMEGAGVHLRRAFGYQHTPYFDPFLLLDDFRSDNPDDYRAGFPWHPHRGIETITYILQGSVEHGDSLGHRGVISSGDVQWMTAGRGIIHQEMPLGDGEGRMQGFQLWANLPASQKMIPPRYRDVSAAQIPLVQSSAGAQIRVISGQVGDTRGAVEELLIEPQFLDISLPSGTRFEHPIPQGHTAFAYVIDGEGMFSPDAAQSYGNHSLILYADGEAIEVSTREHPVRFLLFSGKPLDEPIAWHGPIVMNTQEELMQAYKELEEGTFISD